MESKGAARAKQLDKQHDPHPSTTQRTSTLLRSGCFRDRLSMNFVKDRNWGEEGTRAIV